MFNFYNESHEYILFLDTEFDQQELVQFSGLLFRRVSDNNYAIYRSLNLYIQGPVTAAFTRYTGLSTQFLEHNGVTLEDARWQIMDCLLKDVGKNILLVSHGLHSDLTVLSNNGIVIPHAAEFCTFEKAKTILGRQTRLSLDDIAIETSIYPVMEHNAYIDTWVTVGVYNYLKDIEEKDGIC